MNGSDTTSLHQGLKIIQAPLGRLWDLKRISKLMPWMGIQKEIPDFQDVNKGWLMVT